MTGLKPGLNTLHDGALKSRSTRSYQISRITGMISGRREVFFTMKRFRS